MTSVLTNTAAMSALSSLTSTQSQLSRTQAQISSGLAVANASDNAAYWSIGQSMSAQVVGLSAVQQGLSLTQSIADVTAAALSSIKTSLDKMQADVVAAQQSGVDLPSVQSDIEAQQNSILAIAGNAASFNGVNWLINNLSTSDTTTIVGTSSVSATDLQSIALGQEPAGTQSIYQSTVTTTSSVTEGGSTASTTSTSHVTVTKTDNGDGTAPTPQSVVDDLPLSSSGDAGIGKVVVPMSVSASGSLVTYSFSLVPLVLFSNSVGTDTSTTEISYHGGLPVRTASDSFSTTTSSYSHGGGGILDGTIVLTRSVTAGDASSGNQPSSPQYYFDPITGGEVEQSSSSSGSSGGPTTETIDETILTMSVVGTSASELAEMGAEVQAAIKGHHQRLHDSRFLADPDLHAADLQLLPVRRPHLGHRLSRRRRHERRFDPPSSLANPAATRNPGSLDGEPEQPADPQAVPGGRSAPHGRRDAGEPASRR